jgi:hypothetical protein
MPPSFMLYQKRSPRSWGISRLTRRSSTRSTPTTSVTGGAHNESVVPSKLSVKADVANLQGWDNTRSLTSMLAVGKSMREAVSQSEWWIAIARSGSTQ